MKTCILSSVLALALLAGTGPAKAAPVSGSLSAISMAVTINNGMSDAWVSDDAGFQGIFISVYQVLGFVFIAWFTFDSVPPDGDIMSNLAAADNRWLTALGTISGDTVSLNVENTGGGIFNASQPQATQDTNYGTMTIVFHDCDNATVTYNFPGNGLSGQFQIHRVLTDKVALCEELDGS